MSTPIQVSPATRRLNAFVLYFDQITVGQHDRYTAQQIKDYFAAIGARASLKSFVDAATELGYTFADTPTATRTETVKETQLYGI